MLLSSSPVIDLDEDNDVSWDEVLGFVHKNLGVLLNFVVFALVCVDLLAAPYDSGPPYDSDSAAYDSVSNMARALMSVLLWCNVMYMLLPYEYFGVLTIIVYQILFRDILRFLVIFFLMTLGFAQARPAETRVLVCAARTLN